MADSTLTVLLKYLCDKVLDKIDMRRFLTEIFEVLVQLIVSAGKEAFIAVDVHAARKYLLPAF